MIRTLLTRSQGGRQSLSSPSTLQTRCELLPRLSHPHRIRTQEPAETTGALLTFTAEPPTWLTTDVSRHVTLGGGWWKPCPLPARLPPSRMHTQSTPTPHPPLLSALRDKKCLFASLSRLFCKHFKSHYAICQVPSKLNYLVRFVPCNAWNM